MAEIDQADKHGKLSPFITYKECLELPYLYVECPSPIRLAMCFPFCVPPKLSGTYDVRQAVIKEAMRVHPSIGFPLERVVPRGGAVICGTHLPGGTNVAMSAPVVNCDISIFGADAGDFRPERWIEASPNKIKDMERAFFSVSFCLSILIILCQSVSISSIYVCMANFG